MIFEDKKCNIWSTGYSVSGGEQIKSLTLIYDNIECDFFTLYTLNYLQDSKQERENKVDRFSVVLPGDKTLVRVKYIIELIDPVLGSFGKFIIEKLEQHSRTNGIVDNIFLTVRNKSG